MAKAIQAREPKTEFTPDMVSEEKVRLLVKGMNETELMATDRIVYMAIVMDSEPIDTDVMASPITQLELVKLTGLALRTIHNCVVRLKERGLIQVMPRKETQFGNGLLFIIR